MSTRNLRWDPYLLASGEKAGSLLTEHFSAKDTRKILFILGKGFDIRMNFVLKKLLADMPSLDIDFWLVCYDEGGDSTSHKYKEYVDKNMAEFTDLIGTSICIHKQISLWKEEGNRKRRIGDREAAAIVNDIKDIENYTEIFVDISALPRGIYFSLIGKILHLIDTMPLETPKINFIVTAAENARIDSCIVENTIDTEGKFLMGFMGGVKSSSERGESLIWLPIIGEDKEPHIRVAHEELDPTEVCPLFPFPAKDPHRPDALLIKYHKLLFDVIKVEPQNLMYVPEQNPFEAYKILVQTVRNYYHSLEILSGCRAALSTFSSKLLSIGTLLAAYQVNIVDNLDIIGVMNVDAKGYDILELDQMENFNQNSELFVIWLTGDPYEG